MDLLQRPCTRRALSTTTDAEIRAAYKTLSKRAAKGSVYGAESAIPNRMCGCCGCFEEEPNGMKRCSRCLIEFYCSAECQRTAWSDHQHVCNPPKTASCRSLCFPCVLCCSIVSPSVLCNKICATITLCAKNARNIFALFYSRHASAVEMAIRLKSTLQASNITRKSNSTKIGQ